MANEQKKYEISDNKEYFYMAFLSRVVLPLLPKELDYLWVLSKIARDEPIPVRDDDVINALTILISMEILEPKSLEVAYPIVSSSFVTATVEYEIQTRETWDLIGTGVVDFANVETLHKLIAFIQTKLRCGMTEVSADTICTLFGDNNKISMAIGRLMSTGYLSQSFGGFCIGLEHRNYTPSAEWDVLKTTRTALLETARNAYMTDRLIRTSNSQMGLLIELVLGMKHRTMPDVSESVLGTAGLATYIKNPDLNHLRLIRDVAFLHDQQLLAIENDGVYLTKELVDYVLATTVGGSRSEVEKEEIEELKGRVAHLERALRDAILLITELGERQEAVGDGRVYRRPHPGPEGRRGGHDRSDYGRDGYDRNYRDDREERGDRQPRYLERIRREDERRRAEDSEIGGGLEFRNFVHRRESFRDDSFRHGRGWDRSQPTSNVAAMREGLMRVREAAGTDQAQPMGVMRPHMHAEKCDCLGCATLRLSTFMVEHRS